jgi:predicted HTH domain antitoxin
MGQRMDDVNLDLDDDLVEALRQVGQPVNAAAREFIVLELYRRALISAGKAAQLLGMDRLAFIRYSGDLGIPYFRMSGEEWEAEVQRIRNT